MIVNKWFILVAIVFAVQTLNILSLPWQLRNYLLYLTCQNKLWFIKKVISEFSCSETVAVVKKFTVILLSDTVIWNFPIYLQYKDVTLCCKYNTCFLRFFCSSFPSFFSNRYFQVNFMVFFLLTNTIVGFLNINYSKGTKWNELWKLPW